MHIVLYFGSFNPVHNGHVAISEWVVERGLCDEIWLVVSPRNPFKTDSGLAPEEDRLAMARIAAAESCHPQRIVASDIEFGMPKPSYTIDTLRALEKLRPGDRFSVLIGSDNVDRIDEWKEYRTLLENYTFWVYPRPGDENPALRPGMTLLADAPRWDISSTGIRRELAAGEDIAGLVPPGVAAYLKTHRIWTTKNQSSGK